MDTTQRDKLDENLVENIDNFLYSELLFKDNYSDDISKQCNQLQLVISNICNISCGYCYANNGTYNKSTPLISFNTIKRTIQKYYIKRITSLDGHEIDNYI